MHASRHAQQGVDDILEFLDELKNEEGSTHDCSAYSISHWPMPTSVTLTLRFSVTSGAPIHMADSDGNPDTVGDTTWTPAGAELSQSRVRLGT